MTKKFAIVLALFLIAVVCSAGCIDPETPVDPVVPADPIVPVDPVTPVEPELPVEEYAVMFMLNYDDAGAYTAETVKAGDTVSRPASPSRSGYTFTGWFTAADGGVAYDFTLAVNSDVMLYAQWSKKKSSGGGHSHDWDVVTEPATCGADGLKTSTCSKCGETKTEVLLATGEHSYTNIITSVTCTEDEVSSCSVCGASNPNPTQAMGHNPVENDDNGKLTAKCSVCGEEYKAKLVPNNGENPKYYLEVKDAIGDANDGYTLNLTADMTERVSLDKAVVISTHKHKVNLSYTNIDDIKILKDGCNINDVDVTQNDEAVSFIVTDSIYLEIPDKWDGTIDTSWYNEQDTEFTLTTAEQFAGFADLIDDDEIDGFYGKTITLDANIDLTVENGAFGKSFAPIGSTGERDSSNRLITEPFKGTFDGGGHAIINLYQSGWDFGYEWGKYGSIGLFSELEGATVKNVVLEGFECQIEGGDISFIAGSATGDCTFENIEIKNGKIGTYNNGIGGIIGWSGAGTYNFKDITIGEDVVLGGLWGSFDSSVGGIVGQAEPGATYNFENVDIACRLDVYNDCTASYDYYNYRMCGMIIGRLEETTTIDGSNYPDTSKYNIACTDVTVTYGDWANYHYCEPTPGLNGGRGMRVEAGYAYDGLPADYDHSQCVDNHMNLIPFDQIFGGDQLGVKGLKTYDGVTVIYDNK